MKKKVHVHGPAVVEDENGNMVKGTLVTTCESEPQTMFLRPLKTGDNLVPGDEIGTFKPIKGDDEHMTFQTHRVPGKALTRTSKGPAKVATAAYRDGWDRVWGHVKKGPLN